MTRFVVYAQQRAFTRKGVKHGAFERVAVVEATNAAAAFVVAKSAPDRNQRLAAQSPAGWVAVPWPDARTFPPMDVDVALMPAGWSQSLTLALGAWRTLHTPPKRQRLTTSIC